MTEKKDVAKKEEGQVARRVTGPDGPLGIDQIDVNEDIKMPRLSILQSTSQIVQDGRGQLGQLAHSILQEVYGEKLEIIPLFLFKSRARFEQGEGLVLMSRDNRVIDFAAEKYKDYIGKDIAAFPHDEDQSKSAIDWVGDKPPTFNLVYNFLCMRVDAPEEFPLCLSLMKTAVKTAKDFCSMVSFTREDMFARVYEISAHKEKNEKGTFAVPDIKFMRRCTDEEYKIAQHMFETFYHKRDQIAVDLESESENYTTPEE